jgi:hypothetical protein
MDGVGWRHEESRFWEGKQARCSAACAGKTQPCRQTGDEGRENGILSPAGKAILPRQAAAGAAGMFDPMPQVIPTCHQGKRPEEFFFE